MALKLGQLKTKWNKEKDFYRVQEMGTGVQSFVKDFLESPDLFGLKHGTGSKKDELRKNEFIWEKSKKEKEGRADFVIFINADIIIPVEVECFGKIKSGEKQILQYQLSWDRKYGILTDGFYWRFYNNNDFSSFTLNEYFDNPDTFLYFWREYIKPENYYLAYFEPQGQRSLLKETDILPVEQSRQIFFEDITKLIRSLETNLNIEGYFKEFPKQEQAKKAVEITYAYIIQFILYKTLVDNDFGHFNREFKDFVESIHQCLKSQQYGKILGIIEGISHEISQNIYRPFAKEQEFIANLLRQLIRQPKNELHEVSPWLDIFVFIKKYNFANVKNEIFGYIYENYLKELYEESKKGQYFTDPAIVNFMLDQIGYAPKELNKRLGNKPGDDYVSIVDPSCGSGTFLHSAVDRIIKAVPNGSRESSTKVEELVNNNVFGLDIAEFPLYLAEMNILMRMLPLIITEKYNNPVEKKIKVFLTKDSVAEFINAGLKNTVNDIDVASGQQKLFNAKMLDFEFESYMREKDDLSEMKQSMRPPRRRFDFVIGNPPYVSYNECSKQGVLIMKLIQSKKVQMSDIYGVNLNTVPGRIKPYSPKPNLYAFFIALGISLLKDIGRLCYIVPQTLLTAGDLDVIRYHLAKFTTIEKIITFSGNMFVGRGLKQNKPIPTSSLIFVLNRQTPPSLNKVEIINYTDPNDTVEITLRNISDGKKVSKKQILQNELFQNIANWNFIKHSKKYSDFYETYKRNTIDIGFFRAQLEPEEDFSFDGGVIIDNKKILSEYILGNFEIFDYRNNNWNLYTVSKSNNYYSINSPLSYPAGSQGLKTFLKKFKIIWRTRFTNNFQFTDKPILLINNQSLIVSSNSKEELLFYFALLNSPTSKVIFEKSLKQENERNYLIPLKAVKSLIRIPNVTKNNQFIKDEIIKKTQELLALEDVKLSDLVDFSNVVMQKFDKIAVEGNNIILVKSSRIIKCKILQNKKLAEKVIRDKFSNNKLFHEEKISLSELKDTPTVDFEKQKALKDYLDDLVFVLYFNIPLSKTGVNQAESIKKECQNNKFYQITNKSNFVVQ